MVEKKNRTVAFFDGQNLFLTAKEIFGTSSPDFNPLELARYICVKQDWKLEHVYFYTGIPSEAKNRYWNLYWRNKINQMKRDGIHVYHREIRYSDVPVINSDGTTSMISRGREKGIDIRIALDMVRMARENCYDIALLFSQDQDFTEVVKEIKYVAKRKSGGSQLHALFLVLVPTN